MIPDLGGDKAKALVARFFRLIPIALTVDSPERGTGTAVVLPHVNVEAMAIHLAEVSHNVTKGAHAVLVLDQAG